MATFEIPTENGYKTVQADNKQAALQQVGSEARLRVPSPVQVGDVINSASLNQRQPYVLPDTPSYNYGGLGGATESVVSQTRTADQQARDMAKKNTDSSLQDYLDAVVQSGSLSSSIDRTEQDAAKKKVDEYTSLLEEEQLANRRASESLQKKSGGRLAGAVNQEIDRLSRESFSKQADIAILQTAANRRYDTMASIADRQYAMKLEQSTANLNALKFFYEKNQSSFDKADERLYSEKIAQQTRDLKKQDDLEKDIRDIKVMAAKNGASLGVISALGKAKSLDEVLNTPGLSNYFTSPADKLDLQLKKLQIAKAGNDLKPGGDLNKVLTYDEATKAGVPLGTTYGQYNALQGKIQPTEAQTKTFNAAQGLLTKLQTGITGLSGNVPVGVGNIGFKLPGSKRADFVAAANNLTALLTLDNLKYLKGPTSDKDVAFLTNASTALNRNQSVPEYTKTLQEIVNTLSKYSPEYQYSQAGYDMAAQQSSDPYSRQLQLINQ